jgi:hypothetical protein
MSKRRRLRRSLVALLLPAILLAVGWTGLWYVLAGRVAAQVMAWEQQQRGRGWVMTQGTPRRSGWPMAAGVTLPDVAISGGARLLPGGLAWHADSLKLAVDIRHLHDLYFGVTGRQTLSLAGAPAIPFQAAAFAGQLGLAPGPNAGLLQLHASGLIAAIATAGGRASPVPIAVLDAAVLAAGAAGADGQALALAATASDIGLPPHLLPGLGRSVRRLSFDAAISGPLPASDAASDPVAAATAWHRAGGSLALRALHLSYGPLTLDGAGQLQLDDALRPEGSVMLHVSGLDGTLDAFADHGTLTRPEARAIRAMLGLMMRPPGTDVPGADALAAPLSLHAGVVSLGAIPLFRAPFP